MVILGNEIRLLSVDASTFLGLTEGRNAAEILITTANSVVLYEVKSHKPISSWSTSLVDNQLAVTPCCYDVPKNRFLTTFQNKVIRSWTSEDDRIECGQKFAVPHPIHAVVPFSNGDAEAVVIFENGGISFLHDPSTIIDSDASHCWNIKSPWVVCGENGVHVGFLSTLEQEIVLHHFSFDENYEKKTHETFPVHRVGLYLKDTHVYAAQDSLIFSLLWSDGSLSRGTYNLSSKEVAWHNYLPLKEMCCQRPIAITSCYDDIILAFISNDGNATCVFYNLKYEAITTKRVLKSDEKILEIRLYNIHEQIYVQLGNDILLLPYSDETSNLSALLGVRIDGHMEKVIGLDKTLMWSSGGLEEWQDKAVNAQKEQGFFSVDFLKLVEEQENIGKCDQAMCQSITEVLRKAKDFVKLSEALKYFQNITDASLVNCLLCYLSSETECEKLLREDASQLETDCQGRHEFIDQILSIPINAVFLLDHLRKLSLDETVWLLWYLRHLLRSQGCLNVASNPDAVQIVDWISMLLDSHFHQFLLLNNEGLCLFLHNLASLVATQVKFLEDQNALYDSMMSLLTKGRQYESQSKLVYGIETLIFQ